MSNAQKGTLGYHRQMAVALLGAESPAVAFLDDKIRESPGGADEQVIAPEEQVVHLLLNLHTNGYPRPAPPAEGGVG